MENIKVYNIGKLIEKELPNRRIHILNKLAIIEGTKGVIVFDNEAVGWKKNTTDATIEIGLTDIPEANMFYAAPQYMADVQIKELMTADYEKMPITDFVTRHDTHHRISSNFNGILKAIDEIR